MKVSDVYNAVNEISPFDSACSWDNCGLICGDMTDDVTGVLVTLDADRYALENAVKNGCNVVVSHHPLVFDALRTVTAADTVYHYIRAGVAVISAHTCLDAAKGGINDILADLLGMTDRKDIIVDGAALGRYGKVSPDCIDRLASAIGARVDSNVCRPIETAAVVSGSGGSMLCDVLAHGCDTFITGEAKHDHFVTAENVGINLFALGHYETEAVIVRPLADKLTKILGTKVLTTDRKPLITRR